MINLLGKKPDQYVFIYYYKLFMQVVAYECIYIFLFILKLTSNKDCNILLHEWF